MKGLFWQGEEDALPRDIHALKMQAMHTFGSNKIFAASDFFTYQASTLRSPPGSAIEDHCRTLCLPHHTVCTFMTSQGRFTGGLSHTWSMLWSGSGLRTVWECIE